MIIIVAAKLGYQVRIFTEAAQRMGQQVTLITDRCHQLEDPWGDEAIPLQFDNPDLASLPALKADGIIGVGDRPAYIASLIAEHLRIQFHPPIAMERAKDKFLARNCFADAGLRTPWFQLFNAAENAASVSSVVPYPCVLKPTGLSASRGVIRANDPVEFAAAFNRIRKLLRSPEVKDDRILVESFIPGREYAVEGILCDSKFQMLAIFDKPDPLDGPFFEETIYITPSRGSVEIQDLIEATVVQAVAALGLTNGPVHSELRVNGDEAWMLEVAGRPIGGLCAQVLKFDGGMSFEELLLRQAVQQNVSQFKREQRSAGVMMIPIPNEGILERVDGVDLAKAVEGVEDVIITAKEGYRMIPLPEGSSYLGFIFARAENSNQVDRILRLAHSKLTFSLLPVLPIVP